MERINQSDEQEMEIVVDSDKKKKWKERREKIQGYSDQELFEAYVYSEEYNWTYEDLEEEIIARWLADKKTRCQI